VVVVVVVVVLLQELKRIDHYKAPGEEGGGRRRREEEEEEEVGGVRRGMSFLRREEVSTPGEDVVLTKITKKKIDRFDGRLSALLMMVLW